MIESNNAYLAVASSQFFPSLAADVSSLQTDIPVLKVAAEALDAYLKETPEYALTVYSKAIEQFPDHAFFYACRSIINEKLDDEEGAFYDYQAAKGLDFNYYTFLEWLENRPFEQESIPAVNSQKELLDHALRAVQEFDYNYALACYTEALTRFGTDADVLVYRGRLYMRLVQYDLALADFQEALALQETHFHALLSRAKLYLAIREQDLALVDFAAAIAQEPENSLGYEERGNFLMEKGVYEKAILDFNSLVTLLPEDFYVFALRADLFEKMENWQYALADYDKAIEFNPYYSDLYAYRAEIKEKLGDVEGAIADRLKYEEIEADED